MGFNKRYLRGNCQKTLGFFPQKLNVQQLLLCVRAYEL